ncbi:MAG TPA: cell division protein FtsL [Burkholderiaceae bacterium]|nr:cell division protein FtsL [Burkholderiaceae bacterium]HRP29401.1 cell division protein FtsL [Burkholderiaceae bacterium]
MTRLNVALLLALLVSSIYLVRVSYDGRRLFTQIDKARREAHQLEVDFDRLNAEKQAQATPSRVEAVARGQLGMRTATPAVTQYVSYSRGAASGGGETGRAPSAPAAGAEAAR